MHEIQTLIQFMDKNHIEYTSGLHSVLCFVGHTHVGNVQFTPHIHTLTFMHSSTTKDDLVRPGHRQNAFKLVSNCFMIEC